MTLLSTVVMNPADWRDWVLLAASMAAALGFCVVVVGVIALWNQWRRHVRQRS